MKTENNKTQIAGQSVERNNVRQITHKFDQLKMYFGEPYEVGNGITIYQPTVGQILEVGESDFYGTLYVFIANPTTYRVQLWDMGVDWNKIKDYELFMMLLQSVRPEISKILFGDEIDFTAFKPYSKTMVQMNEDGEEEEVSIPTLYNEETEMELSEEYYTIIAEYLSIMFNIHPKIEHAKGKITKQSIIEEEKMNLAMRQKEGVDESGLLSLVSACVNHPGFKYKLQELKDVGICEFMDSVQRLQVYESSTALLKGMYSGFISSKDIKPDNYNWMRSLNNN